MLHVVEMKMSYFNAQNQFCRVKYVIYFYLIYDFILINVNLDNLKELSEEYE